MNVSSLVLIAYGWLLFQIAAKIKELDGIVRELERKRDKASTEYLFHDSQDFEVVLYSFIFLPIFSFDHCWSDCRKLEAP